MGGGDGDGDGGGGAMHVPSHRPGFGKWAAMGIGIEIEDCGIVWCMWRREAC